jgi:hypothetical protein
VLDDLERRAGLLDHTLVRAPGPSALRTRSAPPAGADTTRPSS